MYAYRKACECRNIEICNCIVEYIDENVDIDVVYYVQQAGQHNDINFAIYLLEQSYNLTCQNDYDDAFYNVVLADSILLCEWYIKRYPLSKGGFDEGLRAACEIGNFEIVRLMVEKGATTFKDGLLEAIDSKNPNSSIIINYLLSKYTVLDDSFRLQLFKASVVQNMDIDIIQKFLPSSLTEIVDVVYSGYYIPNMNIKTLKFLIQELEKHKGAIDFDKLFKSMLTDWRLRGFTVSLLHYCNKEVVAFLLIRCTDPHAVFEPTYYSKDSSAHSEFVSKLIKYRVPADRLPKCPATTRKLKQLRKKRDVLAEEIQLSLPISKNVEVKEYAKIVVGYVYYDELLSL